MDENIIIHINSIISRWMVIILLQRLIWAIVFTKYDHYSLCIWNGDWGILYGIRRDEKNGSRSLIGLQKSSALRNLTRIAPNQLYLYIYNNIRSVRYGISTHAEWELFEIELHPMRVVRVLFPPVQYCSSERWPQPRAMYWVHAYYIFYTS